MKTVKMETYQAEALKQIFDRSDGLKIGLSALCDALKTAAAFQAQAIKDITGQDYDRPMKIDFEKRTIAWTE